MRASLTYILGALGLLGAARAFLQLVKRTSRHLLNIWLFISSRARGGNYADFYARMMDRRATKGSLFGKPPRAVTGTPDEARRKFAVEFFSHYGWLTKDMSMLDLGCGNGATGVNFIRYLKRGKYTGADVSAECLRIGRQYVEELGLSDKSPNFVHLPSGSLDPLGDGTFDFLYAQDVIVHMPPADVANILKKIHRFMHSNSAFYVTFTRCDSAMPHRFDLVNWGYNASNLSDFVRATSLRGEEISDWNGKYKNNPNIGLMRFQLASL